MSLRIVQRYRVGPLIGRGGSGQVHRAVDELYERPVAIKLVPRLRDTEALHVRRELVALRLLDIPGVVELIDHGNHEGHTFIVMELLEGGRLDTLAGQPFDVWRPAVCAVYETLARVHAAGVVHRDLKPANLLLDSAGTPRITDFGLAEGRALLDVRSDHWEGTPAFMAPEQRSGGPVDHRADLYAMGVLMRRMLGELRPPSGIDALIDRLCAEDPADRPESAREVLEILDPDALAPVGELELPEVSSVADLQALFVSREPDFEHCAEDAAAVLFRRTGGSRMRVRAELAAWARAGRIHTSEHGLEITRPEVERLARQTQMESDGIDPDADLDALLGSAEELVRQGVRGQALALLEAGGALEHRAGLEWYADTCLQMGSPHWVRRAAYAAERAGDAELVRLLDAARSCWTGQFGRSVELLDRCRPSAPFEVWRWALWIQALGRVDRESQRVVLEQARRSIRDEDLPRWRIWAANTAYANGAHAEALEHLQAALASGSLAPAIHIAAMTNAASSCLEVGALDRAVELAEEAWVQAVTHRIAAWEARAVWVLRTARYRRGDALEPSSGLLDAIRRAAPLLEGQGAATEAAIAWRAEAPSVGELADRAARLFAELPDGAALMRALAAHTGNDIGAVDVGPDPDPTLALQAVALAGGTGVEDETIDRWIRHWPPLASDQRLDVLSLDECRALLGVTTP